ncbi:MAG: hypothetical protein ABIJ34_01970 [archaeon]
MSFIDYTRLCNYNPLSMISKDITRITFACIDDLIDRDNTLNTILAGLTAPLYVTIGTALIGLELGIDYVFRRNTAKRKFNNLKRLAKEHNDSLSPAKNHDLFWSIEAEASLHPYGEDVLRLVSLNTTMEDDFTDYRKNDKNNIYNLPFESVMKMFSVLGISELIKKIEDVDPKIKQNSPIFRYFSKKLDPIHAYVSYNALIPV